MINLSEIQKLSTREGKKLDTTKVSKSVLPQLEKSKIAVHTTDEVRGFLGIGEYKNKGAYYHLGNKLAKALNIKTVVTRQVVLRNGKPVRVMFFSNLDKKAMFNELAKLIK